MSPPVYSPYDRNQQQTKRAIQPAPGTSLTSAKKRIQFSGLGYVLPPAPPASVARRNARERNRVKQVNMGFAVLRNHIPTSFCNSSDASGRSSSSSSSSKSRKVSKVDTLRCAVEYIRSLQEMLDGEASTTSETSSASSGENVMSPPSYTTKTFAYGGVHHLHHHHHHHQGAAPAASGTSLSPSCSDASSPTPSYESEHSYFTASSWDPYDNYEAYEATPTDAAAAPNEDELLDAISWWQQSQ